ncbi:MAG: gluconate 2-dehydrogenase subunit 3 family protein [Bacteroidetes bacterium]|nr:gluconate 2-dehydrogenase subunit 3 family protein [Bacteroidota bacterium]
MDRRKSIKTLLIGGVATSVLVDACAPGDKKAEEQKTAAGADATKTDSITRMKEEQEYMKKLNAEPTFFNAHEMATITLLGDIIIPKDDISGSASDAKVPEFIEFIVKDMPEHQTPMRGGLRWLDMESFKRFDKVFTDLNHDQQIQIVEDIAYPEIEYKENGKTVKRGKVKPGMQPGVAFFSLMRDLTATGFYTTEIGFKDVGYKGNMPNQWNGVPADVLKQYNMAYTEKELKECVSFDKA